MYFNVQCSIAFTSAIVSSSLISASPVTNPKNTRVANFVVNCTDAEAIFDSSCWDTLHVPEYLMNWDRTTPICAANEDGTDQDGSTCCEPDEPWSTCFLRLAHGIAGADCSSVIAQTCSWDPTLSTNLPSSVVPQVRYVMRNIYVINSLIASLYDALTVTAASTAGFAQTVQDTLDASQPQPPLNYGSYSTAFTSGPVLLVDHPSLSLETASSDMVAATAFLQSLKQASAVSKLLWSHQANSQFIVDPPKPSIGGFLDQGLDLIMSNVSQFISFANGGAYCDHSAPFFSHQVPSFTDSPKTYITSAFLQQNGWYAVPGPPAADLQTFQAGCDANSYNSTAGFCTQTGKTVFWSSDTTRTYTFSHKGSKGGKSSPSNLLTQAVDNQWVDLKVLFDGNYNCTAAGNAGGDLLNVMPDGSLDVSCLSQLPIYLPCRPKATCPTSVLVDGKCPFGYDGSCA